MICCDICQNWFHGSCVGVDENETTKMEKTKPQYMCSLCTTRKQDQLTLESPSCEGEESRDQQKTLQVRIAFGSPGIWDFFVVTKIYFSCLICAFVLQTTC